MKLGFFAAGTISNATIRGLIKANVGVEEIFVYSAGRGHGDELAREFSFLKLTKTTQEVVDNADIIFVAVLGQFIETTLKGLKFKPHQKLVSFVPAPDIATIKAWTDNSVAVFRAMPLPFIMEHKIPTPIFPADAELEKIFNAAGGCIVAAREKDFSIYMTAGSMMGVYYRFCDLCCSWLSDNGLDQEEAKTYSSRLFLALAEKACNKDASYAELQADYSTKGGTNELIFRAFEANGGAKALTDALNSGFAAITKR